MTDDPFEALFRAGRSTRFDPASDSASVPQEMFQGSGIVQPQGWIEDGVITASKLLIGGGRHLTNPDFETGDLTGWSYANSGGGGGFGAGNDPLWRAQGTYYMTFASTATGYSEISQIVPGFRYGDYIQVSALVANATCQFAVDWRDASNATIGVVPFSAVFPNTGGYGADGPIRRSATFGPAPAGTVAARIIVANRDVSGILLVDDIWLSRVGDLITPNANVLINSDGITISNGKLILKDASGASVLTAAGFAGAWLKFLTYRVYNADFANASTSDIPVSETGGGTPTANYDASVSSLLLPYWVVAASGGVLKQVADATATSGNALQSTATVAGQTNRFYQDVPVTPGQAYRVERNWRYTVSAGDFALNVTTAWYDANHTIIGSAFAGGLTYASTAASYLVETDYVMLGVVAPAKAAYARVTYEVVHNNAATTVWFSSLRLINTLFVSSASASGTLTLTTTPTLVPGATTTVGPGTYIAIGTFDFDISVAGNATCIGALYVDGVAQSAQAIWRPGTTAAVTTGRATVHQSWSFSVSPGSSGVVQLRASKSAAVGTMVANIQHSTVVVLPLP